MKKTTFEDLELQEAEKLQSPAKSNGFHTDAHATAKPKNYQELNGHHAEHPDEDQGELPQCTVEPAPRLPLKLRILRYLQAKRMRLREFFDKKTTIAFFAIIILHYISYRFYMWSVNTPTDQNWINYHMLQISIAINTGIVIGYMTTICMYMYKKSKILLVLQINFIIFMLTRDMGWDLVHHGGWNLVYTIVFTVVSLTIFVFFYAISKLWKKKTCGKIAVVIIVLAMLCYVIMKQKIVHDRTVVWREGFQGMRLNNDRGFCKINLSNRAYPDAYDSNLMFWENWLFSEKECLQRSAGFRIQIQNDVLQINCPAKEVAVKILPKYELWDKQMRSGGKVELSQMVDQHSRLVTLPLHGNYAELDLSSLKEEAFRVFCNGETLLE